MTDVVGTILCATRGGEASHHTQQYAIEMAKSRNVDVLFLYVSNVEFLHNVAPVKYQDVQEELDKMGEFLLLMAKERAEQQGVSASTIVKSGVFREALIATAAETQASLIVLGKPEEHNLTERAFLENLIAELKEKTGVEAVIAGDESAHSER